MCVCTDLRLLFVLLGKNETWTQFSARYLSRFFGILVGMLGLLVVIGEACSEDKAHCDASDGMVFFGISSFYKGVEEWLCALGHTYKAFFSASYVLLAHEAIHVLLNGMHVLWELFWSWSWSWWDRKKNSAGASEGGDEDEERVSLLPVAADVEHAQLNTKAAGKDGPGQDGPGQDGQKKIK
jgi:hypothetical protein